MQLSLVNILRWLRRRIIAALVTFEKQLVSRNCIIQRIQSKTAAVHVICRMNQWMAEGWTIHKRYIGLSLSKVVVECFCKGRCKASCKNSIYSHHLRSWIRYLLIAWQMFFKNSFSNVNPCRGCCWGHFQWFRPPLFLGDSLRSRSWR